MDSVAAFSSYVCGVVGADEGGKALPQACDCAAATRWPALRSVVVRSTESIEETYREDDSADVADVDVEATVPASRIAEVPAIAS